MDVKLSLERKPQRVSCCLHNDSSTLYPAKSRGIMGALPAGHKTAGVSTLRPQQARGASSLSELSSWKSSIPVGSRSGAMLPVAR
ncbi:hypothetical protein GGR55DRAFT_643964 [Xylaria sp. FL0064]|nr:hypothetical protein GGR55DRAFT_643964 [Xylaria sp. FL0064]